MLPLRWDSPHPQLRRPYSRLSPPSKQAQLKTLHTKMNQAKTLAEATCIFARINQKQLTDHYTHCTFLKICLKVRNFAALLFHFNQMRTGTIKPNDVAYNTLLTAFCMQQNMEKAEETISEMTLATGVLPNCRTYSILIKGYADSDQVDIGMERLNSIPQHVRSTDCYTHLMRALAFRKRFAEIISLFRHMEAANITPDSATFHYLIEASFCNEDPDTAESFFEMMPDKKIETSPVTYNALVQGFAKIPHWPKAFHYLKKMEQREIETERETYACIIENLICEFKLDDAAHYLKMALAQFRFLGTEFYNTIIAAYYDIAEIQKAQETLELMEKQGVEKNRTTFHLLMNGSLSDYNFEKAYAIFKKMKNGFILPDLAIFSDIIKGAIMSRDYKKAERLLDEMVDAGIKGDTNFYNELIESYLRLHQTDRAIEAYKQMLLNGVSENQTTINLSIHLHDLRMGKHEAMRLFRQHYKIDCSLLGTTDVLHCEGMTEAVAWTQILCYLEDLKEKKIFWIATGGSEKLNKCIDFRLRWCHLSFEWDVTELDWLMFVPK